MKVKEFQEDIKHTVSCYLSTEAPQHHFNYILLVKVKIQPKLQWGVGEADGWGKWTSCLRINGKSCYKGQETRDGKICLAIFTIIHPRVYGPILHIFIRSFILIIMA